MSNECQVRKLDHKTEEISVAQRADSGTKSASTLLVDIALELYEFGMSKTGEAYSIPKTGPRKVRLLRGGKRSLRAELAAKYFERFNRAAPQQALADALLVIEGSAQQANEEQELHLRVCQVASQASQASQESGQTTYKQWLDIGDETGRAICVTADGWSIEERPPMLFVDTALKSSLPYPERGGSLDELRRLLNIEDCDWPLLLAFWVSILQSDIPHPILALFGEQGTGKTIFTRIVVNLLDPSPVPTRKPPRDVDSWVTAAANSWVVGLDNISTIPDWFSDSLCRAVTGDGDVRRRLYTDGQVFIISMRRVIVMNGIDPGAVRGDLAERMLLIKLQTIEDCDRLTESEIWPAWESAHPRILGALLDLAASVNAVLPSVELKKKPRMADFARIVAAVDVVLGTNGLTQFLGKQAALAADSLEGDEFISRLSKMPEPFNGAASELLELIKLDKPPKGWPANPRAVTQLLRRQGPVMRKAGWKVSDDGGRNKSNATRWQITPPELVRFDDSPDSLTRQQAPSGEPASQASKESQQTTHDGPMRAARL